MASIKLFFIFCIALINGQQYPQSSTSSWYANGAGAAVSQIQNVASASNEGIQALVYKLFDNITVDPNLQSAISEYARLSDNPSTPIMQLIQGKQKLLNSLPEKARSVLEDSYSKQRSNMQDYLEDVRRQLDKTKNPASNQQFNAVNEALAAYMSQGMVSNDITGSYICSAIKQMGTGDAEIAKITEDHFKINPTTAQYDNLCQQQLFGFLVTAQGGTGTPNELLEKAKSKLSQWAQNVQNTASNAANSIYGAATDFRNTVGNAADNFKNTFTGNNQQQPQQQQQPFNSQ